MLLFNPKLHNRKYTDEKTRDLMQKTIDFLENKGLKNLKKDWHDKVWNHDFVEFMKENQVFATLMTPKGYGAEDSRWDTYRNSTKSWFQTLSCQSFLRFFSPLFSRKSIVFCIRSRVFSSVYFRL